MAAGPSKEQVYRAKRKLCIRAEQIVIDAGYCVIRCGAKMVNVFAFQDNGTMGPLVGGIWPRVLRASNGEACVLLESDSATLRTLIGD